MVGADNRAAGAGRRFRISLAAALTVGFGGLVFAAVGGALGIGLWSARENTLALLTRQAEAVIADLVRTTRTHLDPVRDGMVSLQHLVADGMLDPGDRAQLVAYARGTMGPMTHVLGVGLLSADGKIFRVFRKGEARTGIAHLGPRARLTVRRALAEGRQRTTPYWGDLLWNDDIAAALVNLRVPLRRDGRFLGLLTAVVSVAALSKHLNTAPLAPEVRDRFILFDRNHVLAHRRIVTGAYIRSPDHPIPTLAELGDPVLAHLWRKDAREELGLKLTGATRGHVIIHDGKYYPALYREIAGYGAEPLIVGAYIRPGSGLGDEMRRLSRAAFLGLALWAVAVIGALLLGRRLSGPVRRLAAAARATGRLELDVAKRLQGSRLRELDEAAAAFNAMTAGLRWFETYVPRRLVHRLMARETDGDVPSETREVTVMFTDVSGFSPLAEHLGADETAEMLNAHFSILAGCIEGSEGTIDKYIGDSVMAFWGAPDDDPDHPLHACHAALAIAGAIARDNMARRSDGHPPIAIRIGIHSGPAVVGNIGAPGRINYTVIGETVNVAQRLEQAGKRHVAGETTILVSKSVFAAASGGMDAAAFEPLGEQSLPGHGRAVAVYRLMKCRERPD